MIKKIVLFFDKSFFKNKKNISIIWLVITVIAVLPKFFRDKYNNYLIYKNVFWHVFNQMPLYAHYPDLYFDINLYGPVFSLIIAPFALLPNFFGLLLWSLFTTVLILSAIQNLPIKSINIVIILWICLNEYLITAQSFQVNPIMVYIIIMTYVFIERKQDFWSAMLIVLGTFIKLYGVVGLAFFFFSKNKMKFILSLLFWSIICFTIPMLISSPQYIVERYAEWYHALIIKNDVNAVLGSYQDFSVMGVVRRVTNDNSIPNYPFLLGGLLVFGLPYLRFKSYANSKFRLLTLASVLIFTVIFSSGSESPTYIIAFVGVAIWYVEQPIPKRGWVNGLLIFAIILTSLSHTDLFPNYLVDNYVRKYSLKAIPCIVIWLVIIYQLMTLKFEKSIHEDYSDNNTRIQRS
ncbi:glycosyltransferase family 87 protein [Flavobacterium sp.]|uniref:glycosyltransferase family 87 protein n=1 Tax=Flavobacterium sp. TaxID=239 RepID=UPI0025DA90A4|nr:glycosyltransferase family 87 protein [Flavobacterium sp.]